MAHKLLESAVATGGWNLAELKSRCTRRRPRGQNSGVAQALRDALQRRTDRAFAIATKGQRTPTACQAAEMVKAIRSARDVAEGRCSQRKVTTSQVIFAARKAAKTGHASDDGGKVTCNSYGHAWSTTTISATRKTDGSVEVVIERSATRTLKFPAKWWNSVSLHGDVLAGSSFAIRGEFWNRYGETGQFEGVAVSMPSDLSSRFGQFEHGATAEECHAEIARKRGIVAAEVAQKRNEARIERAARLLARISDAAVSANDVRAVGACQSGIASWANSHGLNPATDTIPLRDLAKDTTGARYALLVARHRYAVRQSA